MAETVTMYKRISNTTISAPIPEKLILAHEQQGWVLDRYDADHGPSGNSTGICVCDLAPGATCYCTLESVKKNLGITDHAATTTDALGNAVEVNEVGAMQAIVEGRFDLLDYDATRILAEVYGYGAKKYAEENWRGIPVRSHLNHAVRHILMALHEMRTGVNPEPGEDHLGHALCRVHMATAIREQGGPPKEAMQ